MFVKERGRQKLIQYFFITFVNFSVFVPVSRRQTNNIFPTDSTFSNSFPFQNVSWTIYWHRNSTSSLVERLSSNLIFLRTSPIEHRRSVLVSDTSLIIRQFLTRIVQSLRSYKLWDICFCRRTFRFKNKPSIKFNIGFLTEDVT